MAQLPAILLDLQPAVIIRLAESIDLTFARKALLAEAICQQYFGKAWWDSFLWPAINELNRARNEVAHTLEPSNINDRVIKLSKVYDDLGKLHEKAFRQQTGQELPRVPGSIMRWTGLSRHGIGPD